LAPGQIFGDFLDPLYRPARFNSDEE